MSVPYAPPAAMNRITLESADLSSDVHRCAMAWVLCHMVLARGSRNRPRQVTRTTPTREPTGGHWCAVGHSVQKARGSPKSSYVSSNCTLPPASLSGGMSKISLPLAFWPADSSTSSVGPNSVAKPTS